MRTILVIDDEPAILDLFVANLQYQDVTVITAGNGKIAESMLDVHSPDLIITDLIMPEKEGIETVREVKSQHPHIKIITMSGAVNSSYLEVSKMLGADLTITKPIDFPTLKAEVDLLLA